MKKILKTTIFAFLLISLGSCTNDKNPIAIAKGFKLNTPTVGDIHVLSPENADNIVVSLAWDKSEDGASSVPVYSIEIAKGGTNFAEPISGVKATDLPPTETYTWTEGYLNSILNSTDFPPCFQTDVDIRIKSKVGIAENALVQYSNVITVKITPYIKVLPTMAFAKDGQNPADAPKIAASGLLKVNTDFEGYMWLEVGSYKFYTSQCGVFSASDTKYGVNGSGSLVVDGSGYNVSTAGFYYVKANTASTGVSSMSYSITLITWGIIGNAKTSNTTNSAPAMTYDSTTKLLKASLRLKGGFTFKFRANNSNLINLGGGDAGQGSPNYAGPLMQYGGANITVPVVPNVAINNYIVTLNLNNPRDYKYTLIKQ